ncbi:prephenate dehydratase [Candidatus Marinamargulisbacteria bacterium SCGC AG-333-B06]|nr:prephenate dehydratase [Candidatus Marinamargulisbacteria bacterium SCGC AG-333-B06]
MIGYLGPEGTFTQAAILSFLSMTDCDEKIHMFPSIYGLFEALASHTITKVFIPIENSRGGEVFAAFSGLNQLDESCFISHEVIFPIKQSLMVSAPCDLRDITTLYAHEQSTRQCSLFLHEQLPHVDIVFVASNGVAAAKVAESSGHVACLGYEGAADLFNLVILKPNVHDDDNNRTRFVLISSEQHSLTGNDKTSFVFSTYKDRPGSLCSILSLLSAESINLTRISSKPTSNDLGEYLFFVDCDGHIEDPKLAVCLDTIKQECLYYKFLGSYPKGILP